jgi:hypothetical protein
MQHSRRRICGSQHKKTSKMTTTHRQEIGDIIAKADESFEVGQFMEASKLYLQAHELNPQEHSLWKKRAISQFRANPKSLNALADGLVVLEGFQDWNFIPTIVDMFSALELYDNAIESVSIYISKLFEKLAEEAAISVGVLIAGFETFDREWGQNNPTMNKIREMDLLLDTLKEKLEKKKRENEKRTLKHVGGNKYVSKTDKRLRDKNEHMKYLVTGTVSNYYQTKEREEYLKREGIPQPDEKLSKLEVRQSKHGLAVFAKEDIAANQLITIEPAQFAFTRATDRCQHCAKQVVTVFCEKCGDLYCSVKCREQAANEYHREIDKLGVTEELRRFLNSGITTSSMVVKKYVRFVGMALTRNCRIQDLDELKPIYCTPFKYVDSDRVFNWKLIVRSLGLLGDPRFDFRSYMYVYSVATSNAFDLTKGLLSDMTTGMFRIGTFFNHECEPNATHEPNGNFEVFKASRTIRAGDEVTISYIDQHKPVDERLMLLLFTYGFVCSCNKCKRDAKKHKKKDRDIMARTKRYHADNFYSNEEPNYTIFDSIDSVESQLLD